MKDINSKYFFTDQNYRGKKVFVIGGVILLIYNFSILILLQDYLSFYWEKYFFIIIMTAFVGIIDDLYGSKSIKGFKNHFKSLLEAKITTALLKILIIFISAFIINLNNPLFLIVTNIILILLMANFMNLVDLRPGRAYKVYFLLFLPSIFYKGWQLLFISYVIIFLLIAEAELSEKIILGDSGSNCLGVCLGYFYSTNFSLLLKIIFIIVLLILNFSAEIYSFSRIIENNRFLNYFDKLGRKYVK
ncbi:MAG: glycosyl transferase family 4 [Bacillota bacterium]